MYNQVLKCVYSAILTLFVYCCAAAERVAINESYVQLIDKLHGNSDTMKTINSMQCNEEKCKCLADHYNNIIRSSIHKKSELMLSSMGKNDVSNEDINTIERDIFMLTLEETAIRNQMLTLLLSNDSIEQKERIDLAVSVLKDEIFPTDFSDILVKKFAKK